jgi:hypothetical protein
MRGAIPPLLQYAFVGWCLVKHMDNFLHLHSQYEDAWNFTPFWKFWVRNSPNAPSGFQPRSFQGTVTSRVAGLWAPWHKTSARNIYCCSDHMLLSLLKCKVPPYMYFTRGVVQSVQWLGYGLDERGSIPSRDNDGILRPHHSVQTGSGAHPPSYPKGTAVS